jgi:antitoxin component YwqK of YwqJK toxin-antitoxin module
LKLEAHYSQGKEHGTFKQWFDNGQKRAESNFIHGKKDGIERAWDKDGNLKYETLYKEGQTVESKN